MKNLFLLSLFSITLNAQDYPYDDSSSSNAPEPRSVERQSLPVEGPQRTRRRLQSDSILGIGIKGGGNYTIFQDDTTNSKVSGMGFEGMLSFGWDLVRHPVFFEFETGYRNLLSAEDFPVHVIPFKFGTFYRIRSGKKAFLRPGLAPSLDIRIQDGEFAIIPNLSLSIIYETHTVMFEPMIQLMRIHSDDNFVVMAFRMGIRI